MQFTEDQLDAVRKGATVRLTEGDMDLIVVRADVFARLKESLYDDTPWTDEEMDLLAAENADFLGWEGMETYQEDE